MVGDIACLVVRDARAATLRMFANTCRHRGHELLPAGRYVDQARGQLPLPRLDLRPVRPAKGPRASARSSRSTPTEHGLVELPLEVWHGWAFGHALHPVGAAEVPPFERYVGELAGLLAPYDIGSLVVADRHTYEVAANWKVIAENYHECYHCPLIHPELCQVSPPDSGDNYDLPGAWIGGGMVLRDGMASMSLDGSLAATPLPGVEPDRGGVPPPAAQPAGLRAPRLRDDAPDGAAGAGPDLGRVLVADAARGRRGASGAPGAVEFWDITNRQDWAACESVQRGLESRTSGPGRSRPGRTRSPSWCR